MDTYVIATSRSKARESENQVTLAIYVSLLRSPGLLNTTYTTYDSGVRLCLSLYPSSHSRFLAPQMKAPPHPITISVTFASLLNEHNLGIAGNISRRLREHTYELPRGRCNPAISTFDPVIITPVRFFRGCFFPLTRSRDTTLVLDLVDPFGKNSGGCGESERYSDATIFFFIRSLNGGSQSKKVGNYPRYCVSTRNVYSSSLLITVEGFP